jgi:GNAT superfamily N-acetyltransferase
MQTDWQLSEFEATERGWEAYTRHLANVKMLKHATQDGEPKPGCYYLGIAVGKAVVGHITIRKQPLIVPASHLSNNEGLLLTGQDGTPLYEVFVQTFAVEEAHRRSGYGRALQEAALEKAGALGCYQMRSWSSADKAANYALKISMGFAILPALYPMPGGAPLSGVYFVKRIEKEQMH